MVRDKVRVKVRVDVRVEVRNPNLGLSLGLTVTIPSGYGKAKGKNFTCNVFTISTHFIPAVS